MKILKRKKPLLLFPEGTRTFDGSIGKLQKGVGAIAIRCETRIIPVCIEGAYRSWPRRRALPAPGRVAVFYGDPIEPDTDDAGEVIALLKRKMLGMQKDLRKYLYRG